jgi:hypothetical protein
VHTAGAKEAAHRLISMEQVITTQTFDDRPETLEAAQSAGISICSGRILGLGERDDAQIGLIWEVARQRHFLSALVHGLSAMTSYSLPEYSETNFIANTSQHHPLDNSDSQDYYAGHNYPPGCGKAIIH